MELNLGNLIFIVMRKLRKMIFLAEKNCVNMYLPFAFHSVAAYVYLGPSRPLTRVRKTDTKRRDSEARLDGTLDWKSSVSFLTT